MTSRNQIFTPIKPIKTPSSNSTDITMFATGSYNTLTSLENSSIEVVETRNTQLYTAEALLDPENTDVLATNQDTDVCNSCKRKLLMNAKEHSTITNFFYHLSTYLKDQQFKLATNASVTPSSPSPWKERQEE